MMTEVKMPIEVRLVVRDRECGNTDELIATLQEIADQWHWNQIRAIPCGVIRRSSFNGHQ